MNEHRKNDFVLRVSGSALSVASQETITPAFLSANFRWQQ